MARARALLRSHLPALLLAMFLMLGQSMATLLQPWLGGVLTDQVSSGRGAGHLLWTLFGLICAQAALGYVVSIRLQGVSGRIMADAGAELYAHLQALPLAWHQERQRGDTLALLTGDVHRLGVYVTGNLLPLLPLVVTFIGALLMMFRLAPEIAIVVAILMPLLFVLLKLAGRRLRPLGQASMQAWAEQSALAAQNLELLPVIKAFATTGTEAGRYRACTEQVHLAELRRARLQGAIMPMVQVVGAGVVLLLLGVAGNRILDASMGMGTLVSLFLYGLVLVSPVSQLAGMYGATQAARGAAQRLLDAVSAQPETDTGTIREIPRDGDIDYADVTFAYPGRPPLFQGMRLRVCAGETLALTGSNGAGKSTLVHLLLRLVEPQAGSIRIGGTELQEFSLSALRGQIGLVSQQVMLFNATVAENIAYGREDADQIAIERAAHAARAHDFITALPLGYRTVIGDQGVKLSGGQKQRLALARALLKNPPILILDEPTAMFDPEGESEFVAECREVMRQRTVILITHRPASLALADRVVRLDGGQWVELRDGPGGG